MSTAKVDNYRSQFQTAHEWLEGTIDGMSSEQANFQPEGRAMSPGAHYAHHIQGEDAVFNQMLQNKQPLMAGDFAGKIGTETPAPQGDWSEWARSTGVDLDAVRGYAQAVYKSTDDYLATLSDADLDKELDLSGFGLGMKPVSYMLDIILLDTALHTGEISSVKGLQGLQGYPF